MEDGLTEDQPRQTSRTPYGDFFDELLPQYMAIGMPYDLFWDGPPGARKAFLKAYQIRTETEQRVADSRFWQMGQYIRDALKSVQLKAVAVPVEKIKGLDHYPEKPYMVQADEERKLKEKKAKTEEIRKKQEDQSKLAMAMFQSFVTRMNGSITKKLEKQQAVTGQ